MRLLTAFLILLFACCSDDKQATVKTASTSDTPAQAMRSGHQQDSLITVIDSSILQVDSARIDGETFTAFRLASDLLYVINSRQDTVYKTSVAGTDFEWRDFNSDGYKDIIINYFTNTPGIQDLILFDHSRKEFKEVEGFSNFPASEKIKGTNYYYSYHRSGCADMNWDSDLFYIHNFVAVRIGNIAGYECENRSTKDGIYIHKVTGDQESLIQQIPISTIAKYKDHKWGFIKAYWTSNYKRFM